MTSCSTTLLLIGIASSIAGFKIFFVLKSIHKFLCFLITVVHSTATFSYRSKQDKQQPLANESSLQWILFFGFSTIIIISKAPNLRAYYNWIPIYFPILLTHWFLKSVALTMILIEFLSRIIDESRDIWHENSQTEDLSIKISANLTQSSLITRYDMDWRERCHMISFCFSIIRFIVRFFTHFRFCGFFPVY
jgi:hypothetical protein